MTAHSGNAVLAAVLLLIACTALKDGNEKPAGGSAGTDTTGGLAGGGGASQTGGSAGAPVGGALDSAGEGGSSGDVGMAGNAGDGGDPGDGGETGTFSGCTSAIVTKGTTYYVCQCDTASGAACQDGDDAAVGTTPDKPLRTFERGLQAFDAMQAGDSVAFCKGGSFEVGENNVLSNPRCSADNPCTVRAYDPPWGAEQGLGLPRIHAAGKSAFEIAGGRGYQLLGLSVSGTDAGVVVHSGTSDVLLCWLVLDGVRAGVTLNSGGGRTTRVALRDSLVLNTPLAGVAINEGGCDTCSIEGNGFAQNGMAKKAGDGSDAIAIRTNQPVPNLSIVGNEIRTSSDFSDNRCFSAAIGIYGSHDAARIEGNFIDNDGGSVFLGAPAACRGIVIDGPLKDLVVSGNRVINRGAVSISATECTACAFENNVIVQPNQTAYPIIGIQVGLMSGLVLQNNTIFFGTGSAGADSTAFDFAERAIEGIVMANNATLYRGSGAGFRCAADLETPEAFATAFSYADYNACFSKSGIWNEGTLTQWSAATNLDKHSIAMDPKLIESMGDTFLKPDVGSPLIGTGSPDHHTDADIDGVPRDYPPDIGAYQH